MRNYFEEVKEMLLANEEILPNIIADINEFEEINDFELSFKNLQYKHNIKSIVNYFYKDKAFELAECVIAGMYHTDDKYIMFYEDETLVSFNDDILFELIARNIDEVTEMFMEYYDEIKDFFEIEYLPEELEDLMEEYSDYKYLLKKGIK